MVIHLVRRRLGAICLIASGAACAHAGPLTILYETFAGSEIVAFNVATATQIGSHAGEATNVAASGGKVFWQDGINIFQANPDLTGVSLLWTNLDPPSGFAVDAPDQILYETFAGAEIAALNTATATQIRLP
jgi:hypothetical protein